MDHDFIDRYAVADRYVKRTLPAAERATFEAHLVDCQECADRVLLAEMLRNGTGKPIRVETPPRPVEPKPAKGSSVSTAQLWKLALLFAAAAAALLAVPTAVFLWQLHRLR
jgi:anti-sigma factor RsiW